MKLRKLLAMGLAAIMAVSAMSVSVFAEENTSDDIVLSALNEEGVMQDYTQAEIDALGGSVSAYGGVEIEVTDAPMRKVNYTRNALRLVENFTRTSPASSGTPYNTYNAEFGGWFSYASNCERWSNRLLTCGKSDVNSTIYMHVYGAKDSDDNYIKDFNNEFIMYLYVDNTEKAYAYMRVRDNAGVNIKNINGAHTCYVKLVNNTGGAVSGEAYIGSH